MENVNIYTVTGLTKDIRLILEGSFPEVWVEGEVSNYTVPASGHAYFSLKDSGSVINCVMFKSSGARNAFTAEDGMHVLCRGSVSVYDKRGQYQLYVNKMEVRGRGALQVAFEQLKEKLYKEGLFDESRKKPIPVLPHRLGVVTSATGAAVRDIIKVARRRFPNIEITVRPVSVQGDSAKDEIARGIAEFNEYNKHIEKNESQEHPVDVMIVGRGGGSLEDLWPFNEEIVARAIAASKIPVISAVGHEIDYTIADFVADLRAPTPSAAAELAVPIKENLKTRVEECGRRMYTAMKNGIDALEETIDGLQNSYVLKDPINVFLRLEEDIDSLVSSARGAVTHSVEIKEKELGAFAGKLSALSPLAVLERGYSITFAKGDVVKDAGVLKKGDSLETRLAKGTIKSSVIEVMQ